MHDRGEIEGQIEAIREVYCRAVLPLRTRTVKLLGRKCQARMAFTFLGYEVKMGRKRVTCPDSVTARYVKVFGELGLDEVEIPYDPTQTANLLPALERAFARIEQAVGRDKAKHRRVFAKIRRLLRGC